MKKKLIGVVLFLTLVVSGVFFAGYPMSVVQAVKSNDAALASDCNHVLLRWRQSAEYYEESNSGYHFVYVDVTYKCAYCTLADVIMEQVGYEEHDMKGVAPSPYRMSCTKCGYME